MRAEPILQATALAKTYDQGAATVHALRDVGLAVDAGSFVGVRGRSGSGKTTLLNLLGGLDEPTAGSVSLDGVDLTTLDEQRRSEVRRDDIGFVFQAFGLLPILTAVENVEIPLRLAHARPEERRSRAMELLEHVGLARRAQHRPDELSGGEQQRVAIARALANRPRLLLADEPTGQLDSRTGSDIVRLLAGVVADEGIAAVIATHDPAPLAYADLVLELHDGRLSPAARPPARSRSET